MARSSPELLLVVGALLLPACHRAAAPEESATRRVRCARVESGTAEDVVEVRGIIRPPPDRDAAIASRVAGTLIALPVREGDRVRRGDVVARLDARLFADATRQAQANARQAKAAAEVARAAADRKQQLFDKGIDSRAEAEAARAAAEKADADLATAQAALDAARANEEYADLRSPIDGVVVRLFRRVGESVDASASTPVVEVADPSRLELVAEVPVRDLVRVRRGALARVSVDGVAEPAAGTVGGVAPAVSGETGLGPLRVILADGVTLPIGATARASIVAARREGAFFVPHAAVRGGADGGAEVVVCGTDGKAHVVRVREGAPDGLRVEIAGDVGPGILVVRDGGLGIADGDALDAAHEEESAAP